MKLEKQTKVYQLAPEDTMQAVVVDVIDMGLVEDKYNPGELVHKTKLAFQTDEETDEGKPFLVHSFPIKASLDTRSNLYKTITKILGRTLDSTDYDDEGLLDIDSLLIGRNVNVTIKHNESGDKIYANVVEIGPISGKQAKAALLEPRDYTRVQDREQASE